MPMHPLQHILQTGVFGVLFPMMVLFSSVLVLTGCQSMAQRLPPTPTTEMPQPVTAAATNAVENKPKVKISSCQKFNPGWWIGNVDDPVPPDWYRPDSKFRSQWWQLRNPFHNFTFYVIGVADKRFTRVGKYPDKVFSPEGGWNWAIVRYKWVRLPFVSYQRGRFEMYLGWRERGNFGIKLNF